MSTFALKLIAIIAMLIDHIGAIFISPITDPELYVLFRGIGRLSFPIFAFLLVEGYGHTKDARKYLIRLGTFALISELPFDFAFYQVHYGTGIISDIQSLFDHGFQIEKLKNILVNLNAHQNIFFTLFLGLILIYLMDQVDKKYRNNIIMSNLFDTLLTVGICAVAYFFNSDYDIAGILLITIFYLFRGNKIMQSMSLFIISATLLSNIQEFRQTGNILSIISMLATFAMIPIAFYNGKKGKDIKYFFYIFYPMHLLILFLIYQILILT